MIDFDLLVTFWLCTYMMLFHATRNLILLVRKTTKVNGTLLQRHISLSFIIFVYTIMSQHLEFTNIVLPIGGSHKGHIHYSSKTNTPCS